MSGIKIQYVTLPIAADCCFVSIEAALDQIGEDAKHVSSDVRVSNSWTDSDVQSLQDYLQRQNSLANRVRKDPHLEPFEWYVECCGKRVGSNPK